MLTSRRPIYGRREESIIGLGDLKFRLTDVKLVTVRGLDPLGYTGLSLT